jgi:uncharacterized protein (TIGR02001 family)
MKLSTRHIRPLAAAAFAAVTAGTALAQTAAPAAAPAPTPPEPDWTFSANVGLFSQYVFRGISQTDEKPAIQGGFDITHKSGFYIGTWASNISWISDGLPDASASMEWDFYGGYRFPIYEDFSGDVGVLQYYYPGTYPSGATKADTTEVYFNLTWKWLSAKYSYVVGHKIFGVPDASGSYYLEGNGSYDIVDKVNDYIGKVTVIGHVGYQSYRNYAALSYTDWKGGVQADLSGYTVGVFVTGTNANSAAYTNRFGKDISDTQVVGFVQRTF